MRRKKTYYEKKFSENSNNLAKTWSYINDVIYNFNKKSKQNVLLNGLNKKEELYKINELNQYFVTVGNNMALMFEKEVFYEPPKTYKSFKFIYIDKNQIFNIIKYLKNSKALDAYNMSSEILKKCNENLCQSRSVLVNKSLSNRFISYNFF